MHTLSRISWELSKFGKNDITMGATIKKISEIPFRKKPSKKMEALRKKLLNGPTMTPEQVKEYEKKYPWLKKYKD